MRKWKKRKLEEKNEEVVEKKIKIEPTQAIKDNSEPPITEKKEPITEDTFATCFDKLPNETQIDMAAWVFETIVFGQQCIYPTTQLEKWIVDFNVPTFHRIPEEWVSTISLIVFPPENADGVQLYIMAFCRKTRQCLIVNDNNELFVVDADELFNSKHVIVDAPQKRLKRSQESNVFPFQMRIMSINDCVK